MKEYLVFGEKIQFDPTKKYLDYYLSHGRGCLNVINLEGLLDSLQSGTIPVDEDLRHYMEYLKRWEVDAPRKRMCRALRASGALVLSTDNYFEEEGGDQIIDGLENTGRFAAYFYQAIFKGVPPSTE